jgi:hypothetical protein
MKTYWGSGSIAPHILDLGSGWLLRNKKGYIFPYIIDFTGAHPAAYTIGRGGGGFFTGSKATGA